ncbi:hypothetical protein [Rhodococcus qingshengii]|uniref:hypothetical protein n=1 Tax=Rhodococcus qingshengii TaxID=334542 RepID=UPI00117A018C|nr:hypothetical protein [Rhodococcus qingshengii]
MRNSDCWEIWQHIKIPVDGLVPAEVEQALQRIAQHGGGKYLGKRYRQLVLVGQAVLVFVNEQVGIGMTPIK